jgi:hypothetical protein
MLSKRTSILYALLVVSVVGNVAQHVSCSESSNGMDYSSLYGKPLVDLALKTYASSLGIDEEQAKQGKVAVVARTKEGNCVNLRPEPGAIGTTYIYCFDQTGRMVFQGKT